VDPEGAVEYALSSANHRPVYGGLYSMAEELVLLPGNKISTVTNMLSLP
jgi:hypothetical protein